MYVISRILLMWKGKVWHKQSEGVRRAMLKLIRNDRNNPWVFLSISLSLPLNTVSIWLRIQVHPT